MSDVSRLEGAELDAAVLRANGYEPFSGPWWHNAETKGHISIDRFKPSTDWADGGPIIERERIELVPMIGTTGDWLARLPMQSMNSRGPTPLIAAMRAFVASKENTNA